MRMQRQRAAERQRRSGQRSGSGSSGPEDIWREHLVVVAFYIYSAGLGSVWASCNSTFAKGLPAGQPRVMAGAGKHRLSRSSSAEPTELLAAIRRGLPTQLPPLDSHTVAKLKVGVSSGMLGSPRACRRLELLPPPPVRPTPAAAACELPVPAIPHAVCCPAGSCEPCYTTRRSKRCRRRQTCSSKPASRPSRGCTGRAW